MNKKMETADEKLQLEKMIAEQMGEPSVEIMEWRVKQVRGGFWLIFVINGYEHTSIWQGEYLSDAAEMTECNVNMTTEKWEHYQKKHNKEFNL